MKAASRARASSRGAEWRPRRCGWTRRRVQPLRHFLFRTRITTCYPYRAEPGPYFVPELPHVVAFSLAGGAVRGLLGAAGPQQSLCQHAAAHAACACEPSSGVKMCTIIIMLLQSNTTRNPVTPGSSSWTQSCRTAVTCSGG